MDAFRWVALAAVWAVTVLPGMAAIFRGWLLPWMRSRIASPIVGFMLIFCGVGLGMSSTRRSDQGHEDKNRRGRGRSAPRL